MGIFIATKIVIKPKIKPKDYILHFYYTIKMQLLLLLFQLILLFITKLPKKLHFLKI